jgi:hypothetical protein
MEKYRKTEPPNLHNSECELRVASSDELSAYIDKELPAWKRYLIQQHLKKMRDLHRLRTAVAKD